jgi:hypothetical protein
MKTYEDWPIESVWVVACTGGLPNCVAVQVTVVFGKGVPKESFACTTSGTHVPAAPVQPGHTNCPLPEIIETV